MELITQVEIPKYIIQVQLSKSRRAKYYKRDSKRRGGWYPKELPSTYQSKLDKDIYSIDKKGYLLDENNKRVLKNAQSAGTPRYEKLSGNSFASGYGSPMTRAKLVREMKKFYMPFINDIKTIEDSQFPLWIDWHLYTTIPDRMFDLSNFWFYYKYFEDCLFMWRIKNRSTGKVEYFSDKDKAIEKIKRINKNDKYILLSPVIPDDSIKYITKPGTSPILHPIDDWEERKFVFKIYHDNRNCLKQHPLWNQHKN